MNENYTTILRPLSWTAPSPSHALGTLGVWVGKKILGISDDFSGVENGSGDKTSDWVLFLGVAVIALVATVVGRWWTDGERATRGCARCFASRFATLSHSRCCATA